MDFFPSVKENGVNSHKCTGQTEGGGREGGGVWEKGEAERCREGEEEKEKQGQEDSSKSYNS